MRAGERPAGRSPAVLGAGDSHGDYTGLAVDSLGRVHVVWTGLNRFEQSPQIDFYTGALHDGYAQDAMYARR